MNSNLSHKSTEAMLEDSRSRAVELYFNGTCLIRAVCSGRFQKVPFFSQASMVRRTTWETEKRLILSRAGSIIASTLFFGMIAF